MNNPLVHFEKHLLHSSDRIWPQTNCAVDLWIEILNGWGYEPTAALGFTINLDYEGDQFTFFKFPSSDLEELFGTKLLELSIYDNLEKHVATQIACQHIVLVEVDGYYLPDTAGVSYHTTHTKTTIGINAIDISTGKLRYFHNDFYGVLEGEDYIAIMTSKTPATLFPYVEFIKRSVEKDMDRAALLKPKSFALFRKHISNKNSSNPFEVFRKNFLLQLKNLQSEKFHEYAFNNFRMSGANFELLGSYIAWLNLLQDSEQLVEYCKNIAAATKVLQFKTARMISKQRLDSCNDIFDELELNYTKLYKQLILYI